MPLAAFATLAGATLSMDAVWGDPAGVLALVRVHASAVVGDLVAATALGARLAADLRAAVLAGGGSLLAPDAVPDKT